MLLCLAQTKADAQTVQTYTSLTDWQAAVGTSQQFSEDFSGFTQDTYFQTVAINAGPFSLAQIGQNPFGNLANFIDVPPLQFTDNSGVANAALYTKSGVSTVLMTFNAPVIAWGANFYGAQSSELVNLVVNAPGGGVVATVPVTVDTGFFGFVISPTNGLSSIANSISFQSQIDNPDPTVGQGFGLENVVGAYVPAEFSDVPSNATYLNAADLMFLAGVTTGCVQSDSPDTREYCPDDNVTRQEMAAFIVRAVTGTVTPALYNTTPYFQDVPDTNNFFPHIQKMMDLGITTGCSQNPPLYCPTATIPRWEMAIFMVRARLMLFGASFTTSSTPYFTDVPTNVEGNGQPFPFIQRSFEEHVTNGCGVRCTVRMSWSRGVRWRRSSCGRCSTRPWCWARRRRTSPGRVQTRWNRPRAVRSR
jgi:hypothetical protein